MMKRMIAVLAVLIVLTVSVISANAAAARSLTDRYRYTYKADVSNSTSAADTSIENSDGINTNAATAWIVAVSSVMACAVTAGVIVLAKKNIGKQK